MVRTAVIAPLQELADSNVQLLLDAAEGGPVTSNVIQAVQITAENQAAHRLS